jgi:hypothetical protein
MAATSVASDAADPSAMKCLPRGFGRLNEFDLDDARNGPQGRGDLRRQPVAIGQFDLDFSLPVLLDHDETDLSVAALAQTSRKRGHRRGIAQKTRSAFWTRLASSSSDCTVWMRRLTPSGRSSAATVITTAGRLQQVAVLSQPFGKHDRLILAGRIRQLQHAHLVAGACLALLARGDRCRPAAPPRRRA